MACRWEGNHRSGAAAAMHHRLQWFIHLRAHGMRRMTSTLPTLLVVSENMKPMNINKCHIIIQWLNSPETQNLQWNTVNDFWRSPKVWRFLYAENGVIFQKTWNSGLPLSWWDLFLSGRWCPSRIGVISPALKSIISQLHSVHCLCSHSVLHKPANDRTDSEVTKEMSTYTKHSRCQSSPNACTPLPALTACTHDPHLITPAQHTAHL